MANRLDRIRVRNYRTLADVEVALGGLNVLFGRNGVGKSTLLDTIWFARDCAARNVDLASSSRSHGIGLLYDGAPDGARIELTLSCPEAKYTLAFGLSSGRLEVFPGETLEELASGKVLISRPVGSDKVTFWHPDFNDMTVTLREPEKLSLARYADLAEAPPAAQQMDRVLRLTHLYDTRRFFLSRIKAKGSDSSYETSLWDHGDNLWSVLRNLKDKTAIDDRYATIIRFMREAFPDSFVDLVLEATGPASIYGAFVEKNRKSPILASGVSDGHLQMLLLLTALFSEGSNRPSLLMFDEPEISLHPWAIAVLARAMREAVDNGQKQIVLATHSPALLSQFDPSEILLCEPDEGRTAVRRLSEVSEVADLLEQYAAGSLYLSEAVAPQSALAADGAV